MSQENEHAGGGKLFNLRIWRLLSPFWAKQLKESLEEMANRGMIQNDICDIGNERKLSMVCSRATAKAVVWSLQISCRDLTQIVN